MQYYRLSGEVNYFKQKLPYYHLREIYRVDKWCGTCYRPVSSHTTGGMWGNIFISLYWRIIIALIIQDIFPWHNHLIHCAENKEIDMNFIKDIEVKGFARFISKFIIDTLCIGTVRFIVDSRLWTIKMILCTSLEESVLTLLEDWCRVSPPATVRWTAARACPLLPHLQIMEV